MAAEAHRQQTRGHKPKGRGKSNVITYQGYFGLPRLLLEHPDFIDLSHRAKSLLLDIGYQFNGWNNGDLCVSLSVMKARGWRSKDQLTKAKFELLERGWITETKFGGLNLGPSLYAITWQPIHECGGKLDVSPTTTAPRKL